MGRPPGPVPLMPTGLTSMLMLWLRCTISQMDVPARQTAPRLRERGGGDPDQMEMFLDLLATQ